MANTTAKWWLKYVLVFCYIWIPKPPEEGNGWTCDTFDSLPNDTPNCFDVLFPNKATEIEPMPTSIKPSSEQKASPMHA